MNKTLKLKYIFLIFILVSFFSAHITSEDNISKEEKIKILELKKEVNLSNKKRETYSNRDFNQKTKEVKIAPKPEIKPPKTKLHETEITDKKRKEIVSNKNKEIKTFDYNDIIEVIENFNSYEIGINLSPVLYIDGSVDGFIINEMCQDCFLTDIGLNKKDIIFEVNGVNLRENPSELIYFLEDINNYQNNTISFKLLRDDITFKIKTFNN